LLACVSTLALDLRCARRVFLVVLALVAAPAFALDVRANVIAAAGEGDDVAQARRVRMRDNLRPIARNAAAALADPAVTLENLRVGEVLDGSTMLGGAALMRARAQTTISLFGSV
jgi:hypothetical protein